MSLTLVYIGAAAGLAPAASLRALSGGGAVFVPAGLEGELRELVAEAADPGFGRLLELDPADGEGLDDLAGRAADGDVVVALAGPGGPQLARGLRRRAASGAAGELRTIPAGQAFDDALLGQELVSLKRIVDVLRVECPWDREQTPQDIVGYTVEEVHELADAIASGDLHAEHGELGDLLLQVVLLALMLDEEGAGDLASVAHDIEVKLIRRHPHIFADAVAETPADVKSRWERIKVEQEGRVGIFHDVPAGFPALLYAKKLQQRAASVGFDWDSAAERVPQDRRGARRAGRAVRGSGGGRGRRCGLRPRPTRGSPTRTAPTPAWRTRSATCCSRRSTSRGCCTWTRSSRCARPAAASSAASPARRSSPQPRARTGRRWSCRRRRRTTSGPRRTWPQGRRAGESSPGPGGEPPADAGA